MVGIKSGDCGVVIRYQINEFTCTWLAEQFKAWWHIYPGFMGKVSTLTNFPLEPGCEDYYFLDQAVEDFEYGLDSILTDSIDTPDLDALFGEADAISSSVSLGFLESFSTDSDNSGPQLPVVSNLINYGDRLKLCFCLFHRKVIGQLLSWVIIFLAIQLHMDSGFLCHLIIALWILPLRGLFIIFLISRLALHFRHIAAYFSYQNCSCWYSCLCSGFWWWSDCSFKSAWTT